eukprot:CAMPEP_0174735552 /NCGR_PEP_ID=MMETSP1094-20130205/65183_1 /TAXON_ID=156173 /ORGANISM="Chrysochromulina brevifilum, Strain UTEX LB 985" /LENGTH=97 /DNA_ID=CAMNT_0015938533 /DNA_START=221 /DNA_END=514 /DNA_ORIENTATION=+
MHGVFLPTRRSLSFISSRREKRGSDEGVVRLPFSLRRGGEGRGGRIGVVTVTAGGLLGVLGMMPARDAEGAALAAGVAVAAGAGAAEADEVLVNGEG